jgi:hypothetical protein
MKIVFTILTAVLFSVTLWAQSPEKISYQAIIRNSSDHLLSDQDIGMRISILQGNINGITVYEETQTPKTNVNGLVSIEIGTGTTSDDFSAIDWTAGPYFLCTETDTEGGINYTIIGTTQLLSVPYALHAKTADVLTGTIPEIDPVFSAWDKSKGISITESQINDFGSYIEKEEDPIFETSIAGSITDGDIAHWNNKQEQLIAGAGIDINYNVISAKNQYYLGQDTLGGIVFYIYTDQKGKEHGFIVSKTESIATWQNGESLTNANRSWDGVYNTELMTNSLAIDWITTNFTDEWYFPSVDEISLLWHNRFHVNKALHHANATLLALNADYWVSTEYDDTFALL